MLLFIFSVELVLIHEYIFRVQSVVERTKLPLEFFFFILKQITSDLFREVVHIPWHIRDMTCLCRIYVSRMIDVRRVSVKATCPRVWPHLQTFRQPSFCAITLVPKYHSCDAYHVSMSVHGCSLNLHMQVCTVKMRTRHRSQLTSYFVQIVNLVICQLIPQECERVTDHNSQLTIRKS